MGWGGWGCNGPPPPHQTHTLPPLDTSVSATQGGCLTHRVTSTHTPSRPSPSIADKMGRPAVPPGSPSSELRTSSPTCGTVRHTWYSTQQQGRWGQRATGGRVRAETAARRMMAPPHTASPSPNVLHAVDSLNCPPPPPPTHCPQDMEPHTRVHLPPPHPGWVHAGQGAHASPCRQSSCGLPRRPRCRAHARAPAGRCPRATHAPRTLTFSPPLRTARAPAASSTCCSTAHACRKPVP